MIEKSIFTGGPTPIGLNLGKELGTHSSRPNLLQEGQTFNIFTAALEAQVDLDLANLLEKRTTKCAEFTLSEIQIDKTRPLSY